MSAERTDTIQEPGTATVNREHPWPGLMPFTEAARDFFHGRDIEAAELLRLIKRETLTVLFGQSGLGKSSLLNAGLFPRLRAEDFLPVYVRLDVSPEARPLAEQVLDILAVTCAEHGVEAPEIDEGVTLWEHFHRKDADYWSSRNRLLTPVIVLDQFEEIFTLGQHFEDMEQRCRAFLVQLGDLVEDRAPAEVTRRIDEDPAFAETLDFSRRTYKVVLSFREDYLAEFEGLRGQIRSIMQNRLRLTRMNGEQALDVVLASGGHLVPGPVAEQIVRFVAAPRAGARGDDDLSRLEVEPALLSVVCRELNNQRIRRRQAQITADMLHGGAQQQIIRDYYESAVAGVDQRVREFVEDQLLTEAGFRDSYAYDDALELPGVTRDAISRLIARRLLRLEERSGVLRVELTHDLLTQVARESRDVRQKREAEQRTQALEATRRRRSRRYAAIGAFGTVSAVAIAVVFAVLLKQSNREKERLIETQSNVLLAQANGQFDSDVAAEPQAILARSLGLNPQSSGATGRAVAYLSQRTFPRAVAQHRLRLAPDEHLVSASWTAEGAIRVRTSKGEAMVAKPETAGDIQAGAVTAPDVRAVLQRRLGPATANAPWPGQALPMASDPGGIVYAWIESGDRLRVAAKGEKQEQGIAVAGGLQAPVVVSGDRARLMVRAASGDVLVYGLAPLAERPLRRIPAAKGSLRLGPEGRQVLALDREKVSLYTLASDALVEFPHPLAVNALEVSADGRLMVTACQDKFARVWNLETGGLVAALRHDSSVLVAAFDDKGQRIITGSLDGAARIWSVAGEQLTEPVVTGSAVTEAGLSPDGRLALTYASNERLGVWQVANLPMNRTTVPVAASIVAMDAWTRGGLVALAGADDTISLWKVAEGPGGVGATQVWSRPAPGPVDRNDKLRFSPDGRTLVFADRGTQAHLLDAATGASLGRPLRHRGRVLALAFSPDGTLLATGASDGAARIWRIASQRVVGTPMLHSRELVEHVAFSPDGALLATGTSVNRATLRLWNLDDNALVSRTALGERLSSVAFSRPGEIVAVFDKSVMKLGVLTHRHELSLLERAMKLREPPPAYSLETGTRRRDLDRELWTAAVSPDGTRVAVGAIDGTSRIIDLATMQPIGEPMRNLGVVQAIGFSDDGRWILTRSADGVARVWDGRSGYAVTDNARHANELAGAALLGGGAWLLSAGRDRALALRKVGLDFPSPAPRWLPALLEVAGGGRHDESGTLSWVDDRGQQLRAIAASTAGEGRDWWNAWASGTISRLAAVGDASASATRSGK